MITLVYDGFLSVSERQPLSEKEKKVGEKTPTKKKKKRAVLVSYWLAAQCTGHKFLCISYHSEQNSVPDFSSKH